jgi:hypothetical protein
MYCIKQHTVQELQLGTVAIANNIPGDMCEKLTTLWFVYSMSLKAKIVYTCRPTLRDTELLHMLLHSINYKYVIHLKCHVLL